MFLLDTDVVSLRRRPNLHPVVFQWLESQRQADLHLSVVTLAELARGIVRQRRRNPDFARDLTLWLERTITWFDDRVIPVNAAIAERWGQLSGELGHFNVDLLIAATAIEHDLAVVTRNVRHFEPTGAKVLNPFNNLDLP
ncbi:MAG: type II toxin-antitoxin system VapC family toxin [Caldilineaceae bacterium SB0662_bin_9]|uniref:Ribonuclease VapC n=1 Tax=Caldilineaceae bacterium SB0662_bin_9 TaxID=2605258 RepID=A0A6B1DR72_9CHLR|nr:type II toxin-antitoxin system VapC family toxin [Caldilineaceae bacterium]MYD89707.1 type II toxin-antitoxin system VapC family toxin [Caldilineaceae bacterium SB0662_bin_9]